RPAGTGDSPHQRTALRGAAGGCHRDRRCADLLPRAGTVTPGRALRSRAGEALVMRAVSAWEPALLRTAVIDSLGKLDPRLMAKNPVMFVVEVASVLTSILWVRDLVAPGPDAQPLWFTGQVSLWLWFTVLFSNF